MFELTDRVAIITGASRGIGSAIANAFADQGAKVVLSSRRQEDLDREATAINQRHPGAAEAIAAHAGRPEDLDRLVAATLERHGRIDILVNNAATSPYFGPVLGSELSHWDKTFEVNLRGVFHLTKRVYEASMEARGGAIVNIASVGGLRAGFGLGVYDAMKAGLILFTKQVAVECGPRGVRANAIAPGLVRTKFAEVLWSTEEIYKEVVSRNPLGRIAEPEEIAGTAVFLASDAASYINGEVIVVDGGSGAGGL